MGKDTVVIMTLKQGNDINKKFGELNDSILNLKKSHEEYMIKNGQRLQKFYNDYNSELNNHRLARAEADSFKTMYLANRKIYLNAEQDHIRELRHLSIFTLVSFFLVVFFASK